MEDNPKIHFPSKPRDAAHSNIAISATTQIKQQEIPKMNKSNFYVSILIIAILTFSDNSFGAIYFVDANAGNDRNSGLSPQSAWRSIGKVNSRHYNAGDKILLKGGQTFIGSLIFKSIRGRLNYPFLVSSYGDGRAIVSSRDSTAVSAKYCDFLIIKNLICIGSGRLSGNKNSGIEFYLNTNLTIDSVEVSGYLYSGINTIGGSEIRITNTHVYDNGYCGINVTSDQAGKDNSRDKTVRNVYIGYSVADNNPGCSARMDNHSGNGILVGGVTNAKIEYCEAFNNGWDMPRDGNGPVGIWIYMSDSVVIQHCYSHHNKTSVNGKDGGGFDFDGGVTNSVLQYNLSAYNEGAGYGMFQYASAKTWNNNIVRYNISFHDGWKNGQSGIFMWCDPAAIPMKNLHVYNNTVINKYGHGVNFLPGYYENFVFENNIFLLTDSASKFIGGEYNGASFNKNLYWKTDQELAGLKQTIGNIEVDPLISDPLILLPSSDQLKNLNPRTLNEISFFKLKPESPAVKAGRILLSNGAKDFWGKAFQINEPPNIGADGKQ